MGQLPTESIGDPKLKLANVEEVSRIRAGQHGGAL